MKLYEVKVKPATGHWRTWYRTSKGEATKIFNDQVKALKGQHQPHHALAWLNQVELKTALLAADWCQLLESDAPGPTCDLTPVDLIESRQVLKTWEGVKT